MSQSTLPEMHSLVAGLWGCCKCSLAPEPLQQSMNIPVVSGNDTSLGCYFIDAIQLLSGDLFNLIEPIDMEENSCLLPSY